jgi:ribosomal protein S18 acetylase RimI-like enzyme
MVARDLRVRPATDGDRRALHELWRDFEVEIPMPAHRDRDEERELAEVDEYVRDHVAVVAERDGRLVGFVLARMKGSVRGYVSDLYVTRDARRSGVAAALMREAVSRLREGGARVVELELLAGNHDASTVYERWGFHESIVTLVADVDALEARLSRGAAEPSFGLVFAQTDDEAKVDRAVRSYIPRLGRSARTDIHPPVNGWIAVDDELCSGDPQLLRRLAQELSFRTGGVVLSLGIEEGAVVRYVLFDRGSIADEYCSLPEYDGPLPPGDVVALSANPTVAHRLTGADPDRVRAVARTAASPADLPPPTQLLAELADVLGVPLP